MADDGFFLGDTAKKKRSVPRANGAAKDRSAAPKRQRPATAASTKSRNEDEVSSESDVEQASRGNQRPTEPPPPAPIDPYADETPDERRLRLAQEIVDRYAVGSM
jgi:hypothetical protein